MFSENEYQSHMQSYNKSHCWQYEIRQKNLASDLKQAGLSQADINKLRVSDFKFSYIPKDDKNICHKIKEFIERHEWLGKMPHRPTHRFIATHGGIIAGAIVMATPNAFSNLLGKDMRDKEKLISRGACISWSPKNLGSSLISYSVRWMVKNSPYRFFSAYSDTTARELGTIYQACNFTYLGQNSGAKYEYFDPTTPERGWFSDRNFRKTSSYKRYATELNYEWQQVWSYRDKIFWDKIPEIVASSLKERARNHQKECRRRGLPRKHKYVNILGANKRETKLLQKLFKINNPELINLPYPKDRVPKPSIELTERPSACWPLSNGINIPQKILYSIQEVSKMYGIALWSLYHHIKNDPAFPVVNVGAKKRYLINLDRLNEWLFARQRREAGEKHFLPSSTQLLGGAV